MDPPVYLEKGLLLAGGDVLVVLPLPFQVVEVSNEALQETRVVLLVEADGP